MHVWIEPMDGYANDPAVHVATDTDVGEALAGRAYDFDGTPLHTLTIETGMPEQWWAVDTYLLRINGQWVDAVRFVLFDRTYGRGALRWEADGYVYAGGWSSRASVFNTTRIIGEPVAEVVVHTPGLNVGQSGWCVGRSALDSWGVRYTEGQGERYRGERMHEHWLGIDHGYKTPGASIQSPPHVITLA